ncbi:MAG: hypothetical protein ACK4N5_16405, partial [Myxococcales bacterium]
MPTDPEIPELLASLGFHGPAAQQRAREALEQAGLTHPGKKRISADKLTRVREELASTLVRTCSAPGCQAALRSAAGG